MRIVAFNGSSWHANEPADEATVAAQRDKNELTWFRAGELGQRQLDILSHVFGLHPLAIEDIQEARERPRVEDYAAHTFVILRTPMVRQHDLEWHQVGVFVGDDYVVTASVDLIPSLDAKERQLTSTGLATDRSTPGGLFHAVVDALVDEWVPFMDELEEGVEKLEDAAIHVTDQETLEAIQAMKNKVSRVRKVILPMRDALDSLERSHHPNVDDTARLYLRDVADRCRRLVERLEHVRESTYNAQEAWNATIANRMNQDMRRLTVVFALFLLPTLIASLGGMNFADGFPTWPFWSVTAAVLALFVLGLLAARRARWL